MKYDLRDCTFIIPIRIESEDRKINAEIVLTYLCKHLNANIIILEHDTASKLSEIIRNILYDKTKIEYIFLKNEEGTEIFHRTKFLNMMLRMVKTPIVVNYDADVLLKPDVYEKCCNLIREGNHLVYPYFWGDSQYQVFYSGREKIRNTMILELEDKDFNTCRSEYGQCQFFNTKAYIEGGMENEGFVSYAPEDQERGYRFKKLGYRVMWSDDFIYHLEHTRGINSSGLNPMMEHNNKLFEQIKQMPVEELKEYYSICQK